MIIIIFDDIIFLDKVKDNVLRDKGVVSAVT